MRALLAIAANIWFFCLKGRLKDGSVVAIKVLSIERESMRGEREFVSELTALSGARHENLVRLLGCCVDGASRYLVYDYMENNSITHTFLGNFLQFLDINLFSIICKQCLQRQKSIFFTFPMAVEY